MRPANIPLDLLRFYAEVVKIETRGIARAAARLDEVLRQVDDLEPEVESDTAWDAVLLIIAHSAALSRMFWPLDPRAVKGETAADRQRRKAERRRRGDQLREWLEVQEDSPLNVANREVRNTIEHWDERAEEWVSDAAGLSRHGVRMTTLLEPEDDPKVYIARSYNLRTKIITIGRSQLELVPVIQEADRLWKMFPVIRPDLRTT